MHDLAQDLGDGERLERVVGLDQDAAVGAHGQRGADRLLALLDADGDDDELLGTPGLLQTHRLFDGDLVERVHGHFDVGGLDARPVLLDPHLDVVVDDTFDRHQYFHFLLALA